MNLFSSINEGLKAINKNYQLLLIHFAFLFVLFFGLFFVLSIPLGIMFIGFGIDFTDILKGNFIEIIISSLNLFKKFLLFALFFLLSLVLYVIFIVSLWVYMFGGTLGILYSFLEKNLIFNFRDFHNYGKKYFWKVAFYSVFSALLFFVFLLTIGLLNDLSQYLLGIFKNYSHSLTVFFSVFFYLSLLLVGFCAFILWISITLIGYYTIVHKNLSSLTAFREAKKLIINKPQFLLRSLVLFIFYLLTGGFIISMSSIFAVIPNLGPILAAIYQFLTQFIQVYITLVIFATFFAFYLRLEKSSQEPFQADNISPEEVLPPVQTHPSEGNPPQSETQNP